jgi:hypothetical protein
MIESPLLDELKAEWTIEARREMRRRDILEILEGRFGDVAPALEAELKSVDDNRLGDLLLLAATCRSLASFRKKLSG